MTNEKNCCLEPVLNEQGEVCWLTMKIQKVSTSDTKKPMKKLILENKPLKEIKILELQKQGLWKCKKCGATIQSLNQEPVECPDCKQHSHFEAITKSILADLWKLPKWKDIPAQDLNMVDVYENTLSVIKKCIVFTDEILYKILTLWLISTWKTGNWNTVAFLIFRGEYNTGKTTAFDIIRELGYRIIHAAGTTFPAMVRATHYHNAGLLIDEASDRLDGKTDIGKELLNFVKPSYRKGSKYIVADKDSPEGLLCYNNFGFKAFAGEQTFNTALFSRSIDFVMQEEEPEIPNIKYVQNELDEIQTKLLNYRYKTDSPPDLGMDFCLKGRLREIFESIIATGMHINIDVEDIIKYATNLKQEKIDDLKGTIEYDVLLAIKQLSSISVQSPVTMSEDAPEHLLYSGIFKQMYPDNESMERDEKLKKTQRIGYVLRGLHLKTKRMGIGTVLILNDEKTRKRLTYLYKKYQMGDDT
jgi:hypothetical protein